MHVPGLVFIKLVSHSHLSDLFDLICPAHISIFLSKTPQWFPLIFTASFWSPLLFLFRERHSCSSISHSSTHSNRTNASTFVIRIITPKARSNNGIIGSAEYKPRRAQPLQILRHRKYCRASAYIPVVILEPITIPELSKQDNSHTFSVHNSFKSINRY